MPNHPRQQSLDPDGVLGGSHQEESDCVRYSSHFFNSQLPLQQCASSCYLCGTQLPYFALRHTSEDLVEEDMRLLERGRMMSFPDSGEEGANLTSCAPPFALTPNSPPSVMMATHCFNCTRLLCARCCLLRVAPEPPILEVRNPHTSICNVIADADSSAPTSLLTGVVLFADEQRNPLSEPNPGFVPPRMADEPPSLSSFLGRLLQRGGSTVSRVAHSVSSKVSQARAGTLFGERGYCRGVTICTSCFLFDVGYIVALSGITQATHLFTSLSEATQFSESVPAYCSRGISHIGTGRTVMMHAKKVEERDMILAMLTEERRRLLALGFDNSLKVTGDRGRLLRSFLEQKMAVIFRKLPPGVSEGAAKGKKSKYSDNHSGGKPHLQADFTFDPIDRSAPGAVTCGASSEVIRVVYLNSAGYHKDRGGGVVGPSRPGGEEQSPTIHLITEELALLPEQLESLHSANAEVIDRVKRCLRLAVRDRLRDEDSDLARSYDLLPEPTPGASPLNSKPPAYDRESTASSSDFESIGTASNFSRDPSASLRIVGADGSSVRTFNVESLPASYICTDSRIRNLPPNRLTIAEQQRQQGIPSDSWVNEIAHTALRSPSDYLEEHSVKTLTAMLATTHGALTLLPHYLSIAVVWYSTDGCFEHHWLQCCGLETTASSAGGSVIDESVIQRGVSFIKDVASKALFGACVSLTGDLLATVEDPHNYIGPERASTELGSCGMECARYLGDLSGYVGAFEAPPREAPTSPPSAPTSNFVVTPSEIPISVRWVSSLLQGVKELVEGPIGTKGAVMDVSGRLVAAKGLAVDVDVLTSDITQYMASVTDRENREGSEECQEHPLRRDVVKKDALQECISVCSPTFTAARSSLFRNVGAYAVKHRGMQALFVIVPSSTGIDNSEVYPVKTFTDAQGLLVDYGNGILVGLPEKASQMVLLHRHPKTPRTLSLNLLNFSMRTPIVLSYLDAASVKPSRSLPPSSTTALPTGNRGPPVNRKEPRRNHISDETFDCGICFEPYNTRDRRPVICTSCGNTLCSACVCRISRCSFCRSDIDSAKVVPNVLIMQMLGNAVSSS